MPDPSTAALTLTPEKRENADTALRAEIATDITQISSEDWSRVYPAVLESYHFFKTLQESGLEQFKWYYVLVYRAQELVGIAPCFSMDYSLETTMQGKLRDLVLAVKKVFPGFLNLRALICGLPMGAQGRMGVLDGSREVFSAIVSTMEKIGTDQKIPIIAFKDFAAEDLRLLDGLQDQGFYKFRSLPSTEMRIDFKDFEDYLMKLDQPKRADLRRKFRKVDNRIKLELEVTNDLGAALNEAYDLFCQTEARGETQFEKLPKEFFANIAKNMPQETRYFLWRIGKKLVAVNLCMVSGSYFVGYYVGFDYSLAHEHHLFFVRFRDLINWCIKHKITRYEMGNTSYRAKKTLGFKPVPLFVYAKHLNPRLNPFFKLICKLFKPENFEAVLKEPCGQRT